MAQPANIAHTAPGTKTPAAGKPNDGATSVAPTDAQGRGSPSNTRALADGTGTQVQQRLEISAKKSEQQKAKAKFVKDRSQDTTSSTAKKEVQLVVEKRDTHYLRQCG